MSRGRLKQLRLAETIYKSGETSKYVLTKAQGCNAAAMFRPQADDTVGTLSLLFLWGDRMYANSYIYIIQDPRGRCYVGQSTDITKSVSDTSDMPYTRLFQHVAAVYYQVKDRKLDASIPMIQDYPLRRLNIAVFDEDDPVGPYGISKETYEKFRQYFTPSGKAKIHSTKKDGGAKTQIKTARDGSIGVHILNSNSKSQDKFSRGDYIDMAEIIWISRCQFEGKTMLNKTIGGQQSRWIFENGLNQPEEVNINTSTPAMLTSMLIATTANNDEETKLKQMQAELDALFDKYLDTEMADLMKQQILRDSNSRKNLFKSTKYSTKAMSLKPILSDAIARVLSNNGGGANDKTARFKEEFDEIIDRYSRQGLTRLGFTPNMINKNGDSIIENVAKKIAASLLTSFQSTKLKGNWEWDFEFNIAGEKIKYKGKGGANLGDTFTQTISVSLDQTLAFDTDRTPNWWYEPVHLYTHKLSDEIRWKWTKRVFNYMLKRTHVTDADAGIIARAKSGNVIETLGDVAIVKIEQNQKDTLSGKMKELYLDRLSFKNEIFREWSLFFSTLYSTITYQDWAVRRLEDGNEYAILTNDIVQVNRDMFMVGFSIDEDNSSPFVTDREQWNNIIF